jgi:tRNA 2-thiocytidine biosynthesis protein TtcA
LRYPAHDMKGPAALRRRMRHRVGQAIADFHMIEDRDRVMVCVSGGKDSYTLLGILRELQARAPVHFDLLAVHLDQAFPGSLVHSLAGYLEGRKIPFRVVRKDTLPLVKTKVRQGKTACSLCSRLRRGILYNVAVEEGCNKVALGHHADDIIQTLLLNLFFNGSLKAMPPVLRSDDGRNTVIRPLVYCWESEIAAYAAQEGYPVAASGPCGSEPGLKRKRIRRMLEELQEEIPEIRASVLAALQKVVASHLMDRRLFDFVALDVRTGDVPRELDQALDGETQGAGWMV